MRLEGESMSPRITAGREKRAKIVDAIDVPKYWTPNLRYTPIEKVPSILREKLAALPPEYLSPTFDSITTVVQRREKSKKEIVIPRTAEEAMILYVKALNDPTKVETLKEEDKTLLEKVHESRVDNEYYEDIGTMIAARRVNNNYSKLLSYDWTELEKERKVSYHTTSEQIAHKWNKLQDSLNKQKGGAPTESASKTKRLIRELGQTPVEKRTQALWSHVLTDEQKDGVRNILDIHQDSLAIAAMAYTQAGASSEKERMYKHPSYRAFLDNLRQQYGKDEETGWTARMIAVADFYNEMEHVIVPDIDKLPESLQNELGEHEYKTVPQNNHIRLEDKKHNKLRGLVAEISLALLMKGIPEEPQVPNQHD